MAQETATMSEPAAPNRRELPDAPPPRRSGGSPFRIYKPGQGTYVRWGTAIGAGVLALAFGNFMTDQLARYGVAVQTIGPAVLVVALAAVIFHLVGQRRNVVDFFIATEGEMKKVNWSTRREVLGATRVVIVTLLAIGLFLFLVDVLFIFFFEAIGVLHIGLLGRLLGGGAQ